MSATRPHIRLSPRDTADELRDVLAQLRTDVDAANSAAIAAAKRPAFPWTWAVGIVIAIALAILAQLALLPKGVDLKEVRGETAGELAALRAAVQALREHQLAQAPVLDGLAARIATLERIATTPKKRAR